MSPATPAGGALEAVAPKGPCCGRRSPHETGSPAATDAAAGVTALPRSQDVELEGQAQIVSDAREVP